MKIEVRCPGCGRGYRVEQSRIPADGGQFACKACGGPIRLSPPGSDESSLPREPEGTPHPPSRPAPPPEGPAALPPRPDPRTVVCPRCGLHFEPDGAPEGLSGQGRPGILIVEDLEYFLDIAREALGTKYEVHCARNLRAARETLAAKKVDLILLDLTLENGEDGLNLLRELRPKPCPVILFTSEDEAELYGESWVRFRALGADDLVLKGINAGESLVWKVAALLGETEVEPPDR